MWRRGWRRARSSCGSGWCGPAWWCGVPVLSQTTRPPTYPPTGCPSERITSRGPGTADAGGAVAEEVALRQSGEIPRAFRLEPWQTAPMQLEQHLGGMADAVAAFATAVTTAGLDAPVPTTPDRDVRRLVLQQGQK